VFCGEPNYPDDRQDVLLNPTLIIEVLSPSTENHERGEKFERYKRIESLEYYLLVSQDQPLVEFWHRERERWMQTSMAGLDSTINLSSLGIHLPLSEVYDGVLD
jgi:Uma2 family endonuclease